MAPDLQLTTALVLGLLGAGHCVGMCGGIMAALSLGTGDSQSGTPRRTSFLILLCYNLGRIASYTLAGFLMGSLGWFLGGMGSQAGVVLRTLAGLLLVAMGLYLGGWWMGLTRLERFGHKLWRKLQPAARAGFPIRNPLQALGTGAIWGWLPCGLVYSTLVWAASCAHALKSAALMLAFGLGTLPVLLVTGLMARQVQQFLQHRALRSTAALLVILFGLWTIPGAHQMWVMHHLSPGASHSSHAAHSQSH
ncbi:MAG: sulfite exporter TauE/SafE family protein [Kistimonas sp.]|nr:sulfite exporter TauE/SafE family protein [Kistimonas sp.]